MKLTKDEKYQAGLERARLAIKELEKIGIKTISIEVAATFLPNKPEWERPL